jgi:hypothetical protein
LDFKLTSKRSEGTLNNKILENFITFLTVDRIQNCDLERRNHGRLKLNNIIKYDFSL